MKWFLVLLLMLSSLITVEAKTILQPLTPEYGLSKSEVRNLHLDRHGFLWIATAGGINRYDGNRINELHAKDYRLSEISFNTILEDQQGRLWLSANYTGLYLYDAQAGNFDLFITAPQESDHPIDSTILNVIEYDQEHLLLVVNQAIYKLSITDKQLVKIFDLAEAGYANGWIRNLLLYKEQLFIAAFNGLIHLDMQTGKYQYLPHFPDYLPAPNHDQRHTKSLFLSESYLYVGAVRGLYQLSLAAIETYLQSGKAYQTTVMLPQNNIWHIADYNNTILAATDSGLYTIPESDQNVRLFLSIRETNQDIIDETIVDFTADANGGLFMANRADGAFYWHPQSTAFKHLAKSQDLPFSSERITQLWQNQHHLWFSTNNGLNRYDLQTQTVSSFLTNPDPNQSWHSGNILSFIAQEQHTLWLNTVAGIKAFDLNTNSLVTLNISSDGVADLFSDGASVQLFEKNTNSLIIKQQKRLYRYFPATGIVKAITELEQQLPQQAFGHILGQLADESWLLTTADEIWRWQPDSAKLTKLYQYEDFQPQLNRFATSMVEDSNGKLWIGMQGIGLLGFSTDTLKFTQHFSVDNKLRSNEVFSLLEDNEGDLWFSSRQGLARFEPDNLQIEYFTQADGLPFNEFNNGAAFKLSNGKLIYAGMRGAVKVDPTKLAPVATKLNVVVTDFTVLAGAEHATHGYLNNREFRLSHTDTGLKINFSALSFHNNHKIRYQYWLTGQQNIQYPVQVDSQVLFPQLAPGIYQFHVVAISPRTGEKSLPATITLSISPPFWQSSWAYVFYILIASSFLLTFWHRRRQQASLIKQAHLQVQTSEQRLIQALTSVNSGVFEWLAKGNILISSRLPRMLGTADSLHTITLQQHYSLIHPDDVQEYKKQWQRLLAQPELLMDITYRMRQQNGNWLWFRDQCRVTEVNEQQQPTKILGTYSNITETKANEEKARLFGEAFQQTRDWVVILDNRQRVIAANNSFCQAFGGIEPYVGSPRSHHLGISLVRRRFYTKLLKELTKGDHWQGEEQVITPDGLERDRKSVV